MSIDSRPIFFLFTPRNTEQWRSLFEVALPDYRICTELSDSEAAEVRYLAAWNPPAGLFARFTALEAVFALGAGVDRFLSRPDLAAEVVLVRLTDAGMAQQMIEYVLAGVLRYQRDFDHYAGQQAAALWQPLPGRLAGEVRVSVLGMGEIGGAVAGALAGLGYRVSGWSRQAREQDGVRCIHGWPALDALLAETDILVNLLPNTPETRSLLNAERLGYLPHGAAIINAGRGEQLDEAALLALVDAGQLRGAQLDVLAEEPPAADHPFWRHPKIVLTPHIAAKTLPEPSVAQIAHKLRALREGRVVAGLVRLDRAY